MSAVVALWHREVLRFLLDRSRVFSSIGQPVVFWLMFAGALHRSFTPTGTANYGEYFFPGTLAMIALFTAIFSTITVIEDRKEGFLQSVLVSPVPRWGIALGKILGSATLSLLNALVFFVFAPLVGVPFDPAGAVGAFVVLAVISFALAALGFALAWVMDSTAGYHGIMMLFLMPMLLLSGAFFPAKGAHPIVEFLMAIDPLTYGVAALRYEFYGVGHPTTEGLPALWVCRVVTIGFAVAMFVLGSLVCMRRTARDAT
ncbi:MAG: ABC transporter permease [Planctomycetes bacterium]|nr:ABC transporter permease [Planctomycetota bacterium]